MQLSFAIMEQYNSPNYTSPANCLLVGSGQPRVIENITQHHWGDPTLPWDFYSVIAELCNPNNGQKSAHFIAQGDHGAGKLAACIISPENASWSSGNWTGNLETISIEAHPDECDSCYDTIGELVAWLVQTYFGGTIPPYFPHHYWFNTDCPGTYDLNRILSIAQNYLNGTTTQKDWFDMATLQELSDLIDSRLNAFLDAEVDLVDPTGKTMNVVGKTTLRRKIMYFAHNDAQLLNLENDIKKELDGLAVPAPVPAVPAAPANPNLV